MGSTRLASGVVVAEGVRLAPRGVPDVEAAPGRGCAGGDAHANSPVAPRLGVDVKVILISPSIFGIENR